MDDSLPQNFPPPPYSAHQGTRAAVEAYLTLHAVPVALQVLFFSFFLLWLHIGFCVWNMHLQAKWVSSEFRHNKLIIHLFRAPSWRILTSLPRPAEDWIGFTTAVQTQLSDQPQVWSPQRMSYQPAINMDRLSRAYSSYSGATTPPTWTLSTISNSKELLIVLHPQNLILIVLHPKRHLFDGPQPAPPHSIQGNASSPPAPLPFYMCSYLVFHCSSSWHCYYFGFSRACRQRTTASRWLAHIPTIKTLNPADLIFWQSTPPFIFLR